MSEVQAAIGSDHLTPSETVLLHGDRFAAEAGMLGNKEQLLTDDRKVSADQLAEAALAALVLGAEQAGAIRLEARTRKALFGLMTRQTLYAAPTGGAAAPEDTLESRLAWHLGGQEMEVADVLYAMLERDTTVPASDVLARVKRGLAARGLLESHEVKKLKIFTTCEYRLPESTAALLRASSPDGVRRLLEECEQKRPEVWKLLKKHIGSALARRQETSND